MVMARKKATPAKAGFATIEIAIRNGIGILALNRPELHNAFNEAMIAELTEALLRLGADDGVRAIVLTGNGASFCAGADLNWMKRMTGYSRAENLADARALARMLKTLNDVPKPTIARIHGTAYGGGVGLAACCDIAIAAAEASFALSQAKLGLGLSPRGLERGGRRLVEGSVVHRQHGLVAKHHFIVLAEPVETIRQHPAIGADLADLDKVAFAHASGQHERPR